MVQTARNKPKNNNKNNKSNISADLKAAAVLMNSVQGLLAGQQLTDPSTSHGSKASPIRSELSRQKRLSSQRDDLDDDNDEDNWEDVHRKQKKMKQQLPKQLASSAGGPLAAASGAFIAPTTSVENENQAKIQVVILDGVHDNLKKNPSKFLAALKTLKPNLEIRFSRSTASGAMLIQPKRQEDCGSLLKIDAFPPNSCLGPKVTGRLPRSQVITHQVIIKNLSTEVTEEDVKEMLERQDLPYMSVKRIISRQRDAPTEMMRLVLKDEGKKKYLLKNGLYLDQMRFKCVVAKEDEHKKMAFQCFNCQQWNAHKTAECPNETKCVICGENHRKSECTKSKSDASCANCKGSHAAWATHCPIFKE
jgi:hypothetical protein